MIAKYIRDFIHFFHWPVKRIMTQQQFRYLACGGFMFLFDLAAVNFVYYIILKQAPLVHIVGNLSYTGITVALWVPFPFGFTMSYLLSRFVVFDDTTLKPQTSLFRYILLVASCLFLSYLLLTYFIFTLEMNLTVAKIIQNVLVAIFSFLVQRFFAFKISKPAIE